MRIPLIKPNPPRLSEAADQLRAIEERGIFSNFGPVNSAFERDMLERMFGGAGACMTVCNATIGLMLAIQQAIGDRPKQTRYALMPSFTFAAAAHAAMWCGLTPLYCDIDPLTWSSSAVDEERLLALYGDQIAVVMPYATFGYDIDLSRYENITNRYGIPVVVDAAASLGTIGSDGRGFGAGFSGWVVFSMHATKAFSTGEAGIVYSANVDRIAELRQMCNFGFGAPRSATMAGLNGKLSEIGALLCTLRLEHYEEGMAHRAEMVHLYRDLIPGLTFQPERQHRQAHQFAAAVLPEDLAASRSDLATALREAGIGSASYFSPHLAQQSYFAEHSVWGDLSITDDVAGRAISLPLYDGITPDEVAEVALVMNRELARLPRMPMHLPLQRRMPCIMPSQEPSLLAAAGVLEGGMLVAAVGD
ncbi:DegT/DnrJ/EryC1/StrS family aminotransferase [Acidisoma sp.]|uniref:DegT/DnrJ/EryC1/StrS family aminotransferase n=1 Tax=Acidisoma sp. TaxID=1872115 RepID=UPI003AFFB250